MRQVTPKRTGDIKGHAFTEGVTVLLPDDLAEALVSRGYAIAADEPAYSQPKVKKK